MNDYFFGFLIALLMTWCCAGAMSCPSPGSYEMSKYNKKQKIFVYFAAGPFTWVCLVFACVLVGAEYSYNWILGKLK